MTTVSRNTVFLDKEEKRGSDMMIGKKFGLSVLALGVISAAAWAGPKEEEHFDVSPGVSNGQLVTGGFIDDTQTFIPDVRVFGYEFGEEDPLQPFFAQDPGFNNFPLSNGGTFPANTDFGFDVLSNLQVWDGAGDVSFGLVPNGTSLLLEKGSQFIEVGPDNALPLSGFTIETSDGDGQIEDTHLDAILQGPGGADPALGIYLVEMRLTSTADLLASESFWAVFNAGLDEEAHEEAIEWVETVLVPEPAMAMMMLVGGGLAFSRRRRSA